MSYMYLQFMSISFHCQNRRITKCSLPESQKLFLEITVLTRLIAKCLEMKIVSAVNQICCSASTIKRNMTENLPWPATGIPRIYYVM